MATANNNRFFGRKTAWLTLLVMVGLGFVIVAAPVWIIMPFKPQTARGLEVSFALRRWSPLVTVVALVLGLAIAAWLWRGSRWWKRAFLVLAFIPLFAATWFARQNHFEWMFNPLPNAAYARTSEASFVDDKDVVLAVRLNGEAAAYPIRLMAYHHVVEDTVGGTPIVATY
jgi:thiol:disulfide interchange protein